MLPAQATTACITAFTQQDRAAYFTANQRFHRSIIAASTNRTLIEMHDHLKLRLYRIRYLAVMNMLEWTSAASEPPALLDALMSRDADRLSQSQEKHINFVWKLIELDRPTSPHVQRGPYMTESATRR